MTAIVPTATITSPVTGAHVLTDNNPTLHLASGTYIPVSGTWASTLKGDRLESLELDLQTSGGSHIRYLLAHRTNTSDAFAFTSKGWRGRITGLGHRTTYKVRARAAGRNGWGAWSAVVTFTTKARVSAVNLSVTPGSLTPTCNATLSSPDGLYAAGHTDRDYISGYQVEWMEDVPGHGTVTRCDSGRVAVGGTSTGIAAAYGGEPLAYGPRYQWRVTLWDRDDNIGTVHAWVPVVIAQNLGPTLSPSGVTTRQTTTPTLTATWGANQGAGRWQIYADESMSGQPLRESGVVTFSAATSHGYVPAALPNGTTVYWRAAGRPAGTADFGPWAEPVPIYVGALPSAPSGLAPGGPSAALAEIISDDHPVLTAVYEHPDRDTYGDVPSSRTVEVWAGDLSGSALQSSTDGSPDYTVPMAWQAAALSAVTYAHRWKFTGALGNVSPWSPWAWIRYEAAPAIAVTNPPYPATMLRDRYGSYDGVLVGGPTQGVAGLDPVPYGGVAAALDGSNDYAWASNGSPATALSVLFWAKATAGTGRAALCYGTGWSWIVGCAGGGMYAQTLTSDGNGVATTASVGSTTDGAWHCYTARISGNTVKIRADGGSDATATGTGWSALGGNLGIGGGIGTAFAGSIGPVAIVNRSVTDAESTAFFAARTPAALLAWQRNTPGITGLWLGDESSGTTMRAQIGPDGTYSGSPALGAVAGPFTLDGSADEWIAANPGTATRFNGSSQYATVALPDLGDVWTILGRVRRTTAGTADCLLDLGTGKPIVSVDAAGTLTVAVKGGATRWTSPTGLLANTASHRIAISFGGTSVAAWIDYDPTGTAAGSGTLGTGPGTAHLAATATPGDYLVGDAQDWAILPFMMTVAQVAELRAADEAGQWEDWIRRRDPVALWGMADPYVAVTEPGPTVEWSYTGTTQATYRVQVAQTLTPYETVYDSGVIVSALHSMTVPAGYLLTGVGYTATVDVTDTNGLTGTASAAFTTAFTTPDAPASLTATPSSSTSGVTLAWPAPTVPVREFAGWNVSRRNNPDAAEYDLVETVTDRTLRGTVDYGAALRAGVAYQVTQDTGAAEGTAATASATLAPTVAGSWQLVVGGDARLTLEFAQGGVRDASDRASTPAATYAAIGREVALTEVGTLGGKSGSLTLELWIGELHYEDRIREIARNADPAWLKDAYGRSTLVRITEVGTGVMTAGRLSLPISWVEVDG